MERFDAWSTAIFKKPFSEVTVEEAGSLAQRFPYFSPAQFLYLNKLDDHSEKQQEQHQRSLLYYNQPETFDLFLYPPETVHFESNIVPQQKVEEPAEVIKPVIQIEKAGEEKSGSTNETEAPLTFEPFHTVDYFASQGIKISQEEVGKDKFGKQLKSFTDWLKTMKKLPATELGNNSAGTDSKVQNLAAHSVDETEIVTESMAEVWLKQGNKEKALKTYHKLSLQNPSKRAYFAAKIQSINEQ